MTDALKAFELQFSLSHEHQEKRLAALQELLEQNTDSTNLETGIDIPYFKGGELEDPSDFIKKFDLQLAERETGFGPSFLFARRCKYLVEQPSR